jgi:hypothetical protein
MVRLRHRFAAGALGRTDSPEEIDGNHFTPAIDENGERMYQLSEVGFWVLILPWTEEPDNSSPIGQMKRWLHDYRDTWLGRRP